MYKLIHKDKKSKSLSFRHKNKTNLISINYYINMLKKISNNFTQHSRICLNHSKTDTLHQMLICQPHKFFPEIKKHPKKNKIYQIIRGKQKIIIFNKSKKIIKEFKIDKKNFMLCLDKNQWHQNISLTKYSIHLETIGGPFKRNEDRTYL